MTNEKPKKGKNKPGLLTLFIQNDTDWTRDRAHSILPRLEDEAKELQKLLDANTDKVERNIIALNLKFNLHQQQHLLMDEMSVRKWVALKEEIEQIQKARRSGAGTKLLKKGELLSAAALNAYLRKQAKINEKSLAYVW